MTLHCNYGHDESECVPAEMWYESVGRGIQLLCKDCVNDAEQSGGLVALFLAPIESK
jgi:hypothetical protein